VKNSEVSARDLNTDVMRLIASFFVVMIHVSSANSAVGLALNSISRFSVPVFVLISGYYLLKKDMEISAVLRKVLSLFTLMVFWSAIYYVHELIVGTQKFSPIGCVKYLLTEPVHLWYFYALISLYLFTPLLSLVYHHASKQLYQYVLGLTFLSGSCVAMLLRMDSVSFLNVIIEKMKFPYALGFLFLYLLGGYIRKYTVNHKKVIYCLGIAASILSALAAAVLTDYEIVNNVLFSFLYPGNILAAVAFFLFFNSISVVSRGKLYGILQKCAGATMGIYVLHPLMIKIFASNAFVAALFAGRDLLIPVYTFIIYCVALVCALILKNIPVLKRLV